MIRITLVALIMLFLASSALAAPIVLYVDDANGHDSAGKGTGPGGSAFKSIRYAIDSVDEVNDANIADGFTIWVADGTYANIVNDRNRNIDFHGSPIVLQSHNGPLGCIIDVGASPFDPNRGFNFHSEEGEEAIVKGFTIQNGYTYFDGGGMYLDGASPTIINCIITNNYASWWGGGVACRNGADAQIINCLIINNHADDTGGGVYCDDSSPVIELCTIGGNMAFFGGGIGCDNASPEIANCILWGNTPDDLSGDNVEATYSCVGNGDIGDGGISNNPMFVTGPFGDYYLNQRTSPCVNHIPAYEDRSNIRAYDEFALGNVTTSVCNEEDRASVDMGYHYHLYNGPPFSFQLTVNVFGYGHVYVDPNECGDPNYMVYTTDTHTHDGCCTIRFAAIPDPGYRVWKWEGADYARWYLTNSVTLIADTTVNVYFEPDIPHEYFVPSGFPGSLHPIQDAIYAARDGDIITIAPGIYYEQSIELFNKAIRIRSVAPSNPAVVASTVIKQPVGTELIHDIGMYIYYVGADTILEGLTFSSYRYTRPDRYQEDMEPGEDGLDGLQATGGALYLSYYASPTIRYCVITDCFITGGNGHDGADGDDTHPNGGLGGDPGGAYGGGVFIDEFSGPLFEDCTIKNNTVTSGNGGNGGNGNGSPPFGDGGEGGGWNMNEPRYAAGAAVYIGQNCSPTFRNCTFSDNNSISGTTGLSGFTEPEHLRPQPASNYTMDNFGGAVLCDNYSNSTFINCTFSSNVADTYSVEDNVKLDVSYGGAVCIAEEASVTFESCEFTENQATSGGAVFCINSSPRFVDCGMTGNTAFQGGGLFAVHSMAELLKCRIKNNQATGAGEDPEEAITGFGGGILYEATPALIADCNIIDNLAGFSGGGLYLTGMEYEPTPVELNNCLITGNSAGHDGGGVSCGWDVEVLISNCTIYDNDATGGAGPVFSYGGGLACAYRTNTVVTNSVIWGNSCTDPNGLGRQFSLGSGFDDPCGLRIEASLGVYYSDIQGGVAKGKIDYQYCGDPNHFVWDFNSNLPGSTLDNPLFVSGYYLSQTAAGQASNSKCVNTGSSPDASGLPLGRFRYTTRTDNHYDTAMVDMGYHYRRPGLFAPGDITLDGDVDWDDFVALARYWDHNDCNWPGYCEGSDINKDGDVDFADCAYFVDLWLAGDTVPPIPNPMQWASAPAALSNTSVTMAAVAAIDNTGEPVQYYFDCREDLSQGVCHDSGWQYSRLYVDTGLTTGKLYAYSVKARDTSDLETASSPVAYVLPGEDTTAPLPNPSTWAMAPYATSATSVAMTATIATDPAGVEYYFDCIGGGGHDSGWQDGPIYEDTGLVLGQTYTYVVKTRDKSPSLNVGVPSEPNDATTEENPPGADHDPPLPNPIRWYMIPYRYQDPLTCGPGPLDVCEQMSVYPGTDENGVEYIFICEEYPELSSDWQTEPIHEVSFEGRFVQHTWQVKARDRSPHQNEGGWSVRIRIYQPGSGYEVD